MKKTLWAILLCFSMITGILSTSVFAADPMGNANAPFENATSFLFSDTDITVEEKVDTGYKISGTTLTIHSAGTYVVSGSCSNGSIVIGKGLKDVTLILKDLTLSASSTAPIVVKKSTVATIHLAGTSTLTDNESPAEETTSEDFEGAAIKVKSGATVTFCGDGNLNIVANAKNGIKGGSTAALIFKPSGTITVGGNGKYYGGTKSGAAVNTGIACDGSIVFQQGTYCIKAAGDGIKSAPDATEEAEGTTIDTDSAGAITVNGGTFDIDGDGDGFQADTALTINGGTFDIQTWKGYSLWNDTLADSNSCKGLKVSGDRAEEAGLSPTLLITGGSFTLNTGDDAVHSDAYATITGGVFTIDTGDDGMHADTSLILGTENGAERDPDVTVNHSYEGLEAGTVTIYSGCYHIIADDDGVNAAGGSGNGSDPGNGGDHTFRPGIGGFWGGDQNNGSASSAKNSYNIYIYGGDLYVNCDGDGLDSNGGLYLYGGRQAVFSMKSGGDNSALDADGTILIQGATIFTAGTTGVDGTVKSGWFGSNQKYTASRANYSSGKIVNASAGSEVMFSYRLPKNVSYIMASWPSSLSDTAPSFATASAVTSCKGSSQSHSRNSGTITTAATSISTGVITYTCTQCGKTERRSIPKTVNIEECNHSVESGTSSDAGFDVTFTGDIGVASITVYETKDYDGKSETVAATGKALSRNGDSGAPDSSGDGQVNFTVVLKDGYTLESIGATSGAYKNIKTPSELGLANTYRITKITDNLTVTITTRNDTSEPDTGSNLRTVTFDATGGTASEAALQTKEDGTLPYLPTASRSNYTFDGWYSAADNGTEITTDTVFSENQTVYAHWTYNGSSSGDGDGGNRTYHGLTFETNGGSSIPYKEFPDGTTVETENYTTMRDGYRFIGWYSDRELTDKITRIAMDADKTIYAGWSLINPFTDIRESDWFYEDVMYAYEKGLMIGMGDQAFCPDFTTTRGMIVTILYRMEGTPDRSGKCSFEDVPSGAYYESAIIWATNNGIVLGYGNGCFGPEDLITREQMVAILCRYAKSKGVDTTQKDISLRAFNDYRSISSYAIDAMEWAVNNGIIQGYNGNLMPTGNATRAQVAAILHRFGEHILK